MNPPAYVFIIGMLTHGVLDELYPTPPTYEQLRAAQRA